MRSYAVTDYAVLFRELAIPRLVGTPNHQRVREILKRELIARGFSVEEHVFSGRPARALLGVPSAVNGTNLIGTRAVGPSGRPAVWLVAHYDSKGQPISMAVRLVGFAALLVGLLVVVLAPLPGLALLAAGPGVALLNRVNDNSPGALDNASALVAILMALDQLPAGALVGVIFPDAEEYGLVGARTLAVERGEVFAQSSVINLDSLDDNGRATAFVHRPGRVGAAVAQAVNARRCRAGARPARRIASPRGYSKAPNGGGFFVAIGRIARVRTEDAVRRRGWRPMGRRGQRQDRRCPGRARRSRGALSGRRQRWPHGGHGRGEIVRAAPDPVGNPPGCGVRGRQRRGARPRAAVRGARRAGAARGAHGAQAAHLRSRAFDTALSQAAGSGAGKTRADRYDGAGNWPHVRGQVRPPRGARRRSPQPRPSAGSGARARGIGEPDAGNAGSGERGAGQR